jgi:hypothetical protein
MDYQRGISLRPDPDALARNVLRSLARAAIHVGRNAGKRTIEKHPWPEDRAAIDWLTRAPVSPASMAGSTALTHVQLNFLPSLIPVSAAAAVLVRTVQLSLDGVASVSCPAVSLPTAGWIGEGQAIPVLQGTASAAATLSPYKIAAIIVLTHEMIIGGNAETVMTQVLQENIGASLDAVFLTNAAASAGVSPPGILNGAISVTPAAAGAGAIVTDVSALVAALAPVSGASEVVLIAAPKQAQAIRNVLIDPPLTLTSNALADKTVVAIAPSAIVSSIGAPNIAASIDTTIHMANPAAELVTSPGVVAASQRSIFQTDAIALRFTMDATWAKRGAGVAMITGANWP